MKKAGPCLALALSSLHISFDKGDVVFLLNFLPDPSVDHLFGWIWGKRPGVGRDRESILRELPI